MPEHTIAEDDAGFEVVAAQMLQSSPAAIGKLGTIELDLVCFCCAGQTPVPQMLYILSRNAGMFPATNEVAQEMAARLVQALAYMTCLSPWVHLQNTWAVFDRYASPKTEYVGLSALECYLSPDRARWWTARLPPHTKVLVVSPFVSRVVAPRHAVPNTGVSVVVWRARRGDASGHASTVDEQYWAVGRHAAANGCVRV